jgi:hypothetical protein
MLLENASNVYTPSSTPVQHLLPLETAGVSFRDRTALSCTPGHVLVVFYYDFFFQDQMTLEVSHAMANCRRCSDCTPADSHAAETHWQVSLKVKNVFLRKLLPVTT